MVDTTATFDRKVAALRCHVSQVGDGEHLRPLLEQWGEAVAASCGLPPGSKAEAYRVAKAT